MSIWQHDRIFSAVWDYLDVGQPPQPADVIIVLSGGGFERADYGVELYRQGYADKLLISGGSSRNLMNRALSLGVPEDHIILENKSNSTFENAKFSSAILSQRGFKSAVVVTSPYHTRRSRMLFEEFDQGWQLTVCAVPYDDSVAANWWKDRFLCSAVISEYLKFAWHFIFER